MKLSFKNIIGHGLILLLAIQTFNRSINSIEFYNTPSKIVVDIDDLDYIDSMIEFVFENIMGCSKHTFHDRAISGNIAKLQHIAHLDLKTVQYLKLLFDLKKQQLSHFRIIPANESTICLCYKEVLPQPPQSTHA
ncbi:hypothetical protein [Paludibacter sp.]|uniref:hypothetical protein n=1 Tax=Paludibacter sp. TaxID=1898105 RepID=UPI0013561623|nr:hypothetical protein [Paludibacter sp.]MTK51838.1 STAS domain-containing protein [Paludibacter sp.]